MGWVLSTHLSPTMLRYFAATHAHHKFEGAPTRQSGSLQRAVLLAQSLQQNRGPEAGAQKKKRMKERQDWDA
eukprot:681871-Pelagomonas_calceolata.AAC.1